jgi:hypothetical protein
MEEVPRKNKKNSVIFYSAQQYEIIASVKNSSLTLHLLPAAKTNKLPTHRINNKVLNIGVKEKPPKQ